MQVRIDQIEEPGLKLAGTTSATEDTEAPGGVRLPGPIVFSLELSRAKANVDGGGWLHAVPHVPCCRCLTPVRHPVDREFELHYRPVATAPDEGETELDGSDLDVDYYEGDSLDLRAALVEQVMLDLPMKLLCTEHCQGLCPQCGVNRNEQACECEPASDPRLSPLAELRDRMQAP